MWSAVSLMYLSILGKIQRRICDFIGPDMSSQEKKIWKQLGVKLQIKQEFLALCGIQSNSKIKSEFKTVVCKCNEKRMKFIFRNSIVWSLRATELLSDVLHFNMTLRTGRKDEKTKTKQQKQKQQKLTSMKRNVIILFVDGNIYRYESDKVLLHCYLILNTIRHNTFSLILYSNSNYDNSLCRCADIDELLLHTIG